MLFHNTDFNAKETQFKVCEEGIVSSVTICGLKTATTENTDHIGWMDYYSGYGANRQASTISVLASVFTGIL